MNRNNVSDTLSRDEKNAVVRQKPVTPAAQGVTNSHGVKLSVNMTSDDKKKFLTQLEEWRKLKREKMAAAAAVLAKQKQAEKPKISLPVMPLKSKPVPLKLGGGQEKQSVFERLYKNEKIKRPETQISRENSSEVSKPVTHKVREQIKVAETQSAPNAINDQIKSTVTKQIPELETNHNENSETKPFILAVNNHIEIAESESEPHLINDPNEVAERKPSDPVIQENEISEAVDGPLLKRDENEDAEAKLAFHSDVQEIEVAETVTGPHPVGDQIKDAEPKPASHPVNHEVKIADKNLAPQVLSDQHKVDIKPAFHSVKSIIKKSVSLSMGHQMKTTESKPVKSGLANSSLSVKTDESKKSKVVLRRSLSLMFHQKRKEQNILRRSISTQNLQKLNAKTQKLDRKTFQMLPPRPRASEIVTKSKESVKPAVFATPKSTKPLTSTHLRTKLEDWLKVNGHSLDGYRHLRCFGICDNEKSFTATPAKTVAESVENSVTPNTPLDDSNKENVTPPTVIRRVSPKDVENWLKELHRLIVELKYPVERCEEWLAAIKRKCTSCSQMPIYWECLAALDESKGDIKSAIEDYETAIIKGGEVEAVGDSLAQLFDKMVIESGKKSKPKLEKGLDPKNIFKSSIIKFALQQKALKNLSSSLEPGVRKELYVATPVRRSTRIQTPSKSTHEVASLQTLTPELRKNVTFKTNESLLLD